MDKVVRGGDGGGLQVEGEAGCVMKRERAGEFSWGEK
jgi:hypothetical protein